MKPLLVDIEETRWDAPIVLLTAAVFGWLWLWQVRDSTGFLEADACTHYQIARYAFAEPFRFADVWGRPFKTLLYCVPAHFGGRLGVQCASLVLAVVIAFCAMLIAARAGLKRPAIAFVFTLAQPLLFLHAFSELTELPFTFLLSITVCAALARWWKTTALLAGFLPLARPEGFAFLAVVAAVLAGLLVFERLRPLGSRRTALVSLLLLPIGLVLWSVAGWFLYGRTGSILTWIPDHWPFSQNSVYTAGRKDDLWRLVRFTVSLPGITSPLVFPGLLLGVYVVVQNLRARQATPEVAARGLALFCAGSILVGHSLLYMLGKMATNGELRYMLVAAPFWAVLCAIGWERGFELLRRPMGEALRFAIYATPLPLILNTHAYRVLPIRFESAGETARFVAHWADNYGRQHNRPRIMAADPAIYYFLGRSNIDPQRSVEFTSENVKRLPKGTLLLFDPVYCLFNSDEARVVSGPEAIAAAGWEEIPYFTIGRWRLFRSPE